MPLECYRNGERFATLGSQGGSTTDGRTDVSIKYDGDRKPVASITGVDSNGIYFTKSSNLREIGAELRLESHVLNRGFNPLANDFFKAVMSEIVVVEREIARMRVVRT